MSRQGQGVRGIFLPLQAGWRAVFWERTPRKVDDLVAYEQAHAISIFEAHILAWEHFIPDDLGEEPGIRPIVARSKHANPGSVWSVSPDEESFLGYLAPGELLIEERWLPSAAQRLKGIEATRRFIDGLGKNGDGGAK